jgi:Signal transduction histidine kinase
MRLRWNEELKKLIRGVVLFLVAAVLLANLGLGVFKNRMRRDYTALAAGVLENVRQAYPQVSEEQLFRLLDVPGATEEGWEILARYGIFTEYGSRTLESQEERLLRFQMGMNAILLLTIFLGILAIIIYLQRRQHRIEELQRYMEKLSRGNYCLNLEENNDDELSGLRNEVYRLTVQLKESAALEQGRRQALADSVANISHQLKTPMTSMTILLDNLTENEEMDRITRHRFLTEVRRQLMGMSWLIANMLKLSRLEAGVVELQRTSVEAGQLVEKCTARLQTAAEWKAVGLEVWLQPGAALYVDENWTVEALCNIIKNAIEHSPEGGSVRISASENEIYTKICVADSGSGISGEERERLFQRFYRGSNAAQDSIGIGLALAKEVVEQQHGHIQVESKEGEGTVFSLRFMKI